jgi:hypothetical protein
MKLLEELVEVDAVIAGYLMALLYPLASRQYLHETCDAIELWMHEIHDTRLAPLLKEAARRTDELDMKRRCEEWARAIESRTTQC